MKSSIKLATYNVQNGLDGDDLLRTIRELADEKDGEGINIFCCQEVRKDQNNFVGDEILSVLGKNWQAEYFLAPDFSLTALGLAIFWKNKELNLIDLKRWSLPVLEKVSWWEKTWQKVTQGQLETGNWLAFVFREIDLEKNDRGAMVATLEYEGRKARIVNIHLDWAGGPNHRAKQLRYLKERLESEPPVDYELICGDLNTIGNPAKTKKEVEGFLNILGKEYQDALPKSRSTRPPLQRLDHIFVRGFQPKSTKVLPLAGSDHLPMVIDLN